MTLEGLEPVTMNVHHIFVYSVFQVLQWEINQTQKHRSVSHCLRFLPNCISPIGSISYTDEEVALLGVN